MGIWKKDNYNSVSLNNDLEVDILVIGGGLTGLLTAYFLQDKHIAVVEARKIGEGVTKNTTAKITYLQDRIYTKIKSRRGEKISKLYLNSVLESIESYKDIIEKEKINCDFVNSPSYIFANTKKEIPKLVKEYQFLKSQGINIKKEKLPIETINYLSYKVDDTYTFNPLKFLTSIYNLLTKKGIKIYENTKVIDIKKYKDKYICKTNNNIIKANKVIIASNYPYFLFPYVFPFKSSIEKSYIIISKSNSDKNFNCINTGKTIYSCRFYKDKEKTYQISLGSSHNPSFNQNDNLNFKNVQRIFKIKEEDIIMKYSNMDIITPDYLPFIGRIKENIYIATGYNTWGMTNSFTAAKLIKDLINNKENRYKKVFNPKRLTLIHIIKIPYYSICSLIPYITSKVKKEKSWYKNNVYFYKNKKDTIGVYIDEEGKEHKVKNKCPHLGCSLVFNEAEKTWDCPCHSSRFDCDGNCKKGPSNKDIKLD